MASADVQRTDNSALAEGEQRQLVDSLRKAVNASAWQFVGKVQDLRKKRCTKLHSMEKCEDDIGVFFVPPDRFFAMDATCPHEGG